MDNLNGGLKVLWTFVNGRTNKCNEKDIVGICEQKYK